MKFLSRLLAVAAIMAFAGMAQAQVAQQVTQTAARADSGTSLNGPSGGATSCNTVNTTAALNTVTITPPAGQYVYITGVFIDITANITGLTGQATLSTTNVTGGPFWSLATIIPTAGATGGVFRQIAEWYATPLRSTTPGTAVTFVPSAQSANVIYCIRVAAYTAL